MVAQRSWSSRSRNARSASVPSVSCLCSCRKWLVSRASTRATKTASSSVRIRPVSAPACSALARPSRLATRAESGDRTSRHQRSRDHHDQVGGVQHDPFTDAGIEPHVATPIARQPPSDCCRPVAVGRDDHVVPRHRAGDVARGWPLRSVRDRFRISRFSNVRASASSTVEADLTTDLADLRCHPAKEAEKHMTTHRSPEERKADGKELREAVPRSSHGDWSPAADRPDPVEVITSQDADRVQALVPIRHGRMAVSAFTFYRGAAKIMAGDLASTAVVGSRRPALR